MSGLSAGTTYYYCAIGSTDKGHFFWCGQTVYDPRCRPEITTSAPTDVTAQMAQVHAAIVPSGDDTVAWFRYSAEPRESCNDSFGKRVPEHNQQSVGGGSREVVISETLYGLHAAPRITSAPSPKTAMAQRLVSWSKWSPASAPRSRNRKPSRRRQRNGDPGRPESWHQGGSRTWFRLGEQNPRSPTTASASASKPAALSCRRPRATCDLTRRRSRETALPHVRTADRTYARHDLLLLRRRERCGWCHVWCGPFLYHRSAAARSRYGHNVRANSGRHGRLLGGWNGIVARFGPGGVGPSAADWTSPPAVAPAAARFRTFLYIASV